MSGMSDDPTVAFDARELIQQLDSVDKEAGEKPAALLVLGGSLNGTLFDLDAAVVSIGRSPETTIPLEFDGISREHMLVKAVGEIHTVEDTGSRNGTFLNNDKITVPTELQKGDIIKLGNIALKYLPKGDTERLTYDKLYLEANTDGHTGCFNKTYFNNALEMQLKKAKVTGSPLSLLILDIDHFKKLNDTFGHDAGDFVLKEMANLIRGDGVRENHDIFARYGGEEFCIIFPQTTLKQSFEIAGRLRKLVEEHHFIYDGKRLEVTASIGLADYREGVNIGSDLFKRADESVYKAKEKGRNRVIFYREK